MTCEFGPDARRSVGAWRALLICALAALACGRQAPPSPDDAQRPAPDLTGRAVMVLPVQSPRLEQPGNGALLDEELRFWLEERGTSVRWTFPAQLRRVIARTPALNLQIDALSVSSFHRAEVRRIGDPLFGDLRRLGAVVDARYALLPVAAAYVRPTNGDTARIGRIELAAALIDTIGGEVLWYGIVAGDRGAAADRAVIASAARALATKLIR